MILTLYGTCWAVVYCVIWDACLSICKTPWLVLVGPAVSWVTTFFRDGCLIPTATVGAVKQELCETSLLYLWRFCRASLGM